MDFQYCYGTTCWEDWALFTVLSFCIFQRLVDYLSLFLGYLVNCSISLSVCADDCSLHLEKLGKLGSAFNTNIYTNHQRTLRKCIFWFSMSGMGHGFSSPISSQVMLLLFYEPQFEEQRIGEGVFQTSVCTRWLKQLVTIQIVGLYLQNFWLTRSGLWDLNLNFWHVSR